MPAAARPWHRRERRRSWPSLPALVGFVRVMGLTAALSLMAWVVVPDALGLRPVLVVGGSMGPALRAGDVIQVDTEVPTRLDPGQVVVFADAAGGGELVTHRVVDVAEDGRYRTKGDANAVADSTPVPHEAVRGVVRLVVPAVGVPAMWLRTGQWGPLGAVGALVVAFVCAGWASPRRRLRVP